jgi:hypothetical protein
MFEFHSFRYVSPYFFTTFDLLSHFLLQGSLIHLLLGLVIISLIYFSPSCTNPHPSTSFSSQYFTSVLMSILHSPSSIYFFLQSIFHFCTYVHLPLTLIHLLLLLLVNISLLRLTPSCANPHPSTSSSSQYFTSALKIILR